MPVFNVMMGGRFFRYVLAVVVSLLLSPAANLAAKEFTDLSLSAGYRLDTLDWSIDGAGNPVGSSPNILSELTWRNLKTFQVRGDVASANTMGIYFRGSASLGWVQYGENQDSDYAGDNRTLEFSRSINGVDGSRVMDIKGGIGALISFGDKKQHYFAPLVGYSYHSQKLNMKDGFQALSNSAYYDLYNPDPRYDVIPVGPFADLNSSYDTTWQGMWAGFDVAFDLESRGTAYVRLENHWPDFNARANWNLRDNFDHPVSFEHEASGIGQVLELGWLSLPFKDNWQWGINLGWQRWNTSSGIDRTYITYYYDSDDILVNCSPACISETKLNEVNWVSSSINISASRVIDF